ncbi:MAG: hypothetical protein K0Q92_3609 [Steroidobacteraceae bacterium]|jgi:uncharacterized protein YbaA (DUF1428 family)|nr:hypothetical protein [Steroidobacteraceae bacterium]
MSYIEGFVAAVPRANKDAYKKHAADALPYFKKLGATRMVENWGDDVPDGKVTDFKRSVKANGDEDVIFSWVEYPDKATRDRANEAMRNDQSMTESMSTMPFDGKRMIWGGFEPVNDSGKAERPGYVDGCLIPVPTDRKSDYLEMADKHAALLKEYGATRVVDAWGDDIPAGKVTDYQGAVQAKDGETVIFSWVEWPSKEARDQGWDKAMKDPRMEAMKMPFDGQRMIYGGFATMLDA